MATHAIGLLVTLPGSVDDFSSWFYEKYDGSLAEHDTQVTAFAYVEGAESAVAAARHFATELRQAGVDVTGVDVDLVNTTDIADRAGVTRQYVAQLIAGSTGPGQFPPPLGTPGRSRVWDWGSVNEWLRQVDKADEEVHLTFAQACELQVWLSQPDSVRAEAAVASILSLPKHGAISKAKRFGARSTLKKDANFGGGFTVEIVGREATNVVRAVNTSNARSIADEAEAWLHEINQ